MLVRLVKRAVRIMSETGSESFEVIEKLRLLLQFHQWPELFVYVGPIQYRVPLANYRHFDVAPILGAGGKAFENDEVFRGAKAESNAGQ